jgi:hypothetical protein
VNLVKTHIRTTHITKDQKGKEMEVEGSQIALIFAVETFFSSSFFAYSTTKTRPKPPPKNFPPTITYTFLCLVLA